MRKNTFKIILFYGAMWGIIEATIGYVLHITQLPTGFFLFPIGVFFMAMSYKETNVRSAIFLTACVAASIKISNFFMPIPSVSTPRVIFAIVVEGLVSVMAIPFIVKQYKNKYITPIIRFISAVIPAVVWRILFLGFLLFQNPTSKMLNPDKWIQFLGINAVINGIFICLVSYVINFLYARQTTLYTQQSIRFSPIVIISLFIGAFLSQFLSLLS